MKEIRDRLDILDKEIVALLGKRQSLIDEVIEAKHKNGLPARIPDRIEQVIANVRGHSAHYHADPDLVEKIYRMMIDHAVVYEENKLKE